jgi:hypothetical protein
MRARQGKTERLGGLEVTISSDFVGASGVCLTKATDYKLQI